MRRSLLLALSEAWFGWACPTSTFWEWKNFVVRVSATVLFFTESAPCSLGPGVILAADAIRRPRPNACTTVQ